jgi:ferritin-like metal-binding protein YciE
MPLKTMKELLLNQLNELYAAEKHGAELLPTLAKAATSKDLAGVLGSHSEETTQHQARLEEVFREIGVRPHASRAETNCMKGLARDCLRLARMPKATPEVRDAAIIATVQHIEHDEIAGYGCARTWAEILGYHESAVRLQATLDEERRADADLSRLAARVNRAALAATGATT